VSRLSRSFEWVGKRGVGRGRYSSDYYKLDRQTDEESASEGSGFFERGSWGIRESRSTCGRFWGMNFTGRDDNRFARYSLGRAHVGLGTMEGW